MNWVTLAVSLMLALTIQGVMAAWRNTAAMLRAK